MNDEYDADCMIIFESLSIMEIVLLLVDLI